MSAQEKGVPFTTSTCLVCHESMRFPCQVARCLTLFCCWCAAAHCVGREAAGGWPPGTADPFLLHGSRREGRVRGHVCTRGEVHSPFFHFVRFFGFLEKRFGTKRSRFSATVCWGAVQSRPYSRRIRRKRQAGFRFVERTERIGMWVWAVRTRAGRGKLLHLSVQSAAGPCNV
jgi:hypothetical protein